MELTVNLGEVTAKRLVALATARGVSPESVVSSSLDDLAADRRTRRAILAFRRKAGAGTSLTDLGWLDGYSGQTVDEILAFEASEHPAVLLNTIEEALRHRIEERPGWTGVERVLLSVQAFQHEVNNGGFHQYFFNSSRLHAPVLPDDLRRIGCDTEADIARKAIDALRLERVTAEEIEKALKADEGRSLREALHRCDEAFYALPDHVSPRLLAYVRKHADAIHL